MECALDMNARERLELPIGMIKRYISTHYHYHHVDLALMGRIQRITRMEDRIVKTITYLQMQK